MGQRGPGAKPATARPPRAGAQPRPTRRQPALSRAEAVCAFLESLTITSGALAGSKFRLRAWQRAMVERVYGVDATGKRTRRSVVVSTGRKSGKTTLVAALTLAHLCGPEARRRGQIVSCAADRAQASLLFNEVMAFAMADERKAARLIFRSHNKTVEDVLTGSTLACLSSDAAKAHGTSPSVGICDEVAQWRSRDLLDAVQSGQGAHSEPLLFVISTRSVDPDNPLEQLIGYATEADDPAVASFVYSAPRELDTFSPEAWSAANPDMTPERLADIEALAKQARRLPSMLPAFEAFVCNRPVALDDRWIAPQDWDACSGEAEPVGPVYGGLDLAGGARDLCAFALYWPETRRLVAKAVIPEGLIEEREREDRAPYGIWAAAGHIALCPGRAIDRSFLAHWLAEQVDGLELITIASDRWMLTQFQQEMDREGVTLPVTPFGQGFRDVSPALGAFEALVLDARLRTGTNPLLRWAVSNAAIDVDPAGNRKISKLRSRGRIDPLIASIMAVGEHARQPAPPDFAFTGMFV